MTIAEFFVSLGVKGSEKAVGAVKSVSDGMSHLWNSSTEAKVAIIGVFYGLEQLFAASNRTGAQLKEFSTLTGMSARSLQEYQYAAQQAVGHNVELAGTFTKMQDSIKGMLGGEGGGTFSTLGMMINALNKSGIKVDLNEAKQWLTNVPLLVQRMQQLASLKNVGTVWKRHIIEGMGAGPDFTEALLLGGLTPNKLQAAKPHTYSDAEVNQLTKASTAWANMGTAMDLSVGKFNAKYGPEMAMNIEKIVDALLGPRGLIPALTQLSEKLKVFEVFNRALGGITKGVDLLTVMANGGTIDKVGRAWLDQYAFLFTGHGLRSTSNGNNHTTHNHVTTKVDVHTNSSDPHHHGDIVGKHIKRAITQTPTLVQNN